MKPRRQLHLVAYDVCDAKRLRAALRITRRYATGGQKSVHECWVTAAEKGHLIAELTQVLEPGQDRILILRLDPRQRTTTLGKAVPPADPDWFYLG